MLARLIPPTLFLALSISPAWAQCGPKADVDKTLRSDHGEQVIAEGLSGSGHTVRLYVNPTTRTWTAVGVMPDGTACLFDAGQEMEFAAPKAGRAS